MVHIPEEILAQASAAVGNGSPAERTPQGEVTFNGSTCSVNCVGGHDNPAVLAAVAQIMDGGRAAAMVQERGGFGR